MRIGYRICRFICQWFCALYFKARVHGVHRIPAEGGTLLVCNHQSFVDPILVTMALHREGNYIARDTLFDHRLFKWLIEYLNAFPIRRQSADVGAIKESLRRLKRGCVLVLFPEGTRTLDGRIGPMLPGLGAIAKKAGAPIVPTLIDGVYQAWPKGRLLPARGDVIIEYGEPIHPDAYPHLSPEELMAMVRKRLVVMQQHWHSRLPGRRLQWFESEANSVKASEG